MIAAIDANVGRWVGRSRSASRYAATAARAVWSTAARCGRTRRRAVARGELVKWRMVGRSLYAAGTNWLRAQSILTIFLYRYMISRWHEQRRRRTRSTRSPSPGGGRSSISSPTASARSTSSCELLGLAQPQVSKHLRVLREVGAVDVRDDGRQRLYRLNGHALKPIHDWVKSYEAHVDRAVRRAGRRSRRPQTKEQDDARDDRVAQSRHPADRHRDPDGARVRRAARARLPGVHRRPSWSSAGGRASAAP